jgi:hypothetical protein
LGGVAIAAGGGGIGGLVGVGYTRAVLFDWCHKKLIHAWLELRTSNEKGNQFRTTRAIASHTNLTEDRVRYICSISPNVYLSTGPNDYLWALHTVIPRENLGGRPEPRN